jgi:hypothetical protein
MSESHAKEVAKAIKCLGAIKGTVISGNDGG